jgi:hypothetical protein
MIHYSCDRCRRAIDVKEEVRYVVKVDVSPAMEPLVADESDDDRDYLAEIQDILERVDDVDGDGSGYHQGTYDLCPECYRKYILNPMGNDALAQLGFSAN